MKQNASADKTNMKDKNNLVNDTSAAEQAEPIIDKFCDGEKVLSNDIICEENSDTSFEACTISEEKISGSQKSFLRSVLGYLKLFKIELIIVFSVLIIDLVTKFFIDKFMDEYAVIVLIKNFLNFRYVLNENAAFGSAFGLDKLLGATGVRIFFVVFSIITISLFIYLLYRFRDRGLFVRIGFSLVIGGAFGNLYDRIAFGYVRDFIEIVFFGADIPFIGSTFAIFNIADSALVVGMFMLIFFFIFKYSINEDKDKKKT